MVAATSNNNDTADDHERDLSNAALRRDAPVQKNADASATAAAAVVVEDTTKAAAEEEEEAIRLSNAYTGATNSIHSIYQRRWYLSLDRAGSGFEARGVGEGRRWWVRKGTNEGRNGKGGTGEERTGEERTGEERTGEERTGEERTGEERTGEERTGEERTGEERTGEEGFIVRGPTVERSVATGRRAVEVMRDEGVGEGWVGRAGWRAVDG